MDADHSLTRRTFIKTAGATGAVGAAAIAGGAALVSGALPLGGAIAAGRETASAADPLLRGVSDIHVHASPDSRARSINELDFSRQARDAGYRSLMFKSNDFSCHDRAFIVRQALPDFECFGSLCMNRVHGDTVNPAAAQKAVNTTGGCCRCIWMPTLDAAYQHASEKRPGKGIPVLSDGGAVLPEVVKVMEICAEADIMFATGHASPAESLVMAKMAKEVGLGKFVVTHANSLIWKMTPDEIRRAADHGAWIEFCWLPNLWGPGTGLPDFERATEAEFLNYVSVVPERSFVTTDLGQVNLPNPLDGMRSCIETLQRHGVAGKTIDLLVKTTPATLVGLSPRTAGTEHGEPKG